MVQHPGNTTREPMDQTTDNQRQAFPAFVLAMPLGPTPCETVKSLFIIPPGPVDWPNFTDARVSPPPAPTLSLPFPFSGTSTFVRLVLSIPNTFPFPLELMCDGPAAVALSRCNTAFSSTRRDNGVFGALRRPATTCVLGDRTLWCEGERDDGQDGWKFRHGEGGTGAVDKAGSELLKPDVEEVGSVVGTGSETVEMEAFDDGLTIGEMLSPRRPPFHRFFSSSSARRSPYDDQFVQTYFPGRLAAYLETTTLLP